MLALAGFYRSGQSVHAVIQGRYHAVISKHTAYPASEEPDASIADNHRRNRAASPLFLARQYQAWDAWCVCEDERGNWRLSRAVGIQFLTSPAFSFPGFYPSWSLSLVSLDLLGIRGTCGPVIGAGEASACNSGLRSLLLFSISSFFSPPFLLDPVPSPPDSTLARLLGGRG